MKCRHCGSAYLVEDGDMPLPEKNECAEFFAYLRARAVRPELLRTKFVFENGIPSIQTVEPLASKVSNDHNS